jgi:hypothetical protein
MVDCWDGLSIMLGAAGALHLIRMQGIAGLDLAV